MSSLSILADFQEFRRHTIKKPPLLIQLRKVYNYNPRWTNTSLSGKVGGNGQPGAPVWVKFNNTDKGTYSWVPGIVEKIDRQRQTVEPNYDEVEMSESEYSEDDSNPRARSPKKSRVPGPREANFSNLLPREKDIDESVHNIIKIKDVNEGNIVHLLSLRYENDDNCTYCGDVLIYMNFRVDQEFEMEKKNYFLNKLSKPYFEMNNMVPHLYAMMVSYLHPLVHSVSKVSRSLVFLGESGSGKSMAFKNGLEFIRYCFSPQGLRRKHASNEEEEDRAEQLSQNVT